MTSRVRSSVVLVVAGLALGLSGCGGSDGSPTKDKAASKSTVTPADGETQKTADFSYVAPKGWKKPASPVSGPVSFVGDANDHDGFTDNINVIRTDPAPVDGIAAVESGAEQELKAAHAKDIRVLARQDIDGAEAIHVTSQFSQNGTKYLVDQFSMIHAKVLYVVTFSFSATVTTKHEDSLAQSVLATWKWAS